MAVIYGRGLFVVVEGYGRDVLSSGNAKSWGGITVLPLTGMTAHSWPSVWRSRAMVTRPLSEIVAVASQSSTGMSGCGGRLLTGVIARSAMSYELTGGTRSLISGFGNGSLEVADCPRST